MMDTVDTDIATYNRHNYNTEQSNTLTDGAYRQI